MSAPTDSPDRSANGIAERLNRFFGSQSNEARAPEPREEERTESEPEVPETEEPEAEDLESHRAETEEGDDLEEEELESEPEQKSAGEDEQEEIETTAELAEALGVKEEDLYKGLKVPVGEEKIPLGELIERAQQAPPPTQFRQVLETHHNQFQELVKQQQEAYRQNESAFIASAHVLLNEAENERGFSEAAMAALKQESPEDYLIKVEEKRQFYDRMQQALSAAQQAQAQQLENQRRMRDQLAMVEGAKLIEKIPEWKDSELAMREATAVGKWVQNEFGFTEEEMAEMPDARLGYFFYKAWKQEMAAQKAARRKKTLTLKKQRALKSNIPTRARQPKTDPATTQLSHLRQVARQTARDPRAKRKNEDAAAARLAALVFKE